MTCMGGPITRGWGLISCSLRYFGRMISRTFDSVQSIEFGNQKGSNPHKNVLDFNNMFVY